MARVERILFVVAVVALGWYATVHTHAMLYQASQNRQLEELRLERKDVRLPAPLAGTNAAPRPRTARSLVGRIEIPRLGLSAIVREGVDDRTLSRAVGHVPETAFPGDAGNIALAGHRDTFFRPLKQIRTGDRIRVTTPDGDFSYVVSDTRVVAPTELSVLDPTPEPTLTLITCYPFNYVGSAPNRFIVRALAVDSTPPVPAAQAVVLQAATPAPPPAPTKAPTVTKAIHKRTASIKKGSAKETSGAKRAVQKPKKKGFWRKLWQIVS